MLPLKSNFYTHNCGQHYTHQADCIYFFNFYFISSLWLLFPCCFTLSVIHASRNFVRMYSLLCFKPYFDTFQKSWLYTVHAIWTITHLQCTTMGPALGGLENLTRRIKESSPVAWQGTPWSGQPVKWNCLTSRISLYPLCADMESNVFRWPQIKS